MLCSLFLALFLQILALRYVNQFIPLAAGLITGFLGLMAMFFPAWSCGLCPAPITGCFHGSFGLEPGCAHRDVLPDAVPIADFALLAAAL